MHDTDSPLLGSYRTRPNSKDRPVGVWNVDGEVLRQASLSLRYATSDIHIIYQTRKTMFATFPSIEKRVENTTHIESIFDELRGLR